MKKNFKVFALVVILLSCVSGLVGADELLSNAQAWEPCGNLPGDEQMISAIQACPENPSKAFVGYNNGEVYVSENVFDPAPFWTKLLPSQSGFSIEGMVTGIAVDPYNNAKIFVTLNGEEINSLITSDDGGYSWALLATPPSITDIRNISINPIDPALLYLIADGIIYISEDGGISWVEDILYDPASDPMQISLESGDSISTIEQIAYTPSKVFVGTKNGQIYICSQVYDSNPYWYKVTDDYDLPQRPITSIAVDMRNTIPTLYAASTRTNLGENEQDGLWRSNSGGVDWESVHNTEIPPNVILCKISINPYYQDILYSAYLPGNAARSLDKGETWTEYTVEESANLKVQYRDGGWGGIFDNHIKPNLQIINLGESDINLDELTIKYWYTIDGEQEQQLWIDYAYIGNMNVTGSFISMDNPTADADYYLEVEFSTNAGVIPANGSSGEIQLRWNKTDWTNYNEDNDYSYKSTGYLYEDNECITLYLNGKLIWGTEP